MKDIPVLLLLASPVQARGEPQTLRCSAGATGGTGTRRPEGGGARPEDHAKGPDGPMLVGWGGEELFDFQLTALP